MDEFNPLNRVIFMHKSYPKLLGLYLISTPPKLALNQGLVRLTFL